MILKTLLIFTKHAQQNCLFLVNDTTPVSDNPLHFRNNVFERTKNNCKQLMIRLEIRNCNLTLTEKQQKCLP